MNSDLATSPGFYEQYLEAEIVHGDAGAEALLYGHESRRAPLDARGRLILAAAAPAFRSGADMFSALMEAREQRRPYCRLPEPAGPLTIAQAWRVALATVPERAAA